MKKLKLLLAVCALFGVSVAYAQTPAPFLKEKNSFGGTVVSQLSTFVPGAGTTYTLELTGCVASQEITVPSGSFSYTPTTSGTVRFVRNGGDVVYVYEGTTYKGTVSVSTPDDPTFPDIYGATDNSGSGTGIYSASNLFSNPGFETKGDKISDHNYKGTNWDCNGYTYTNKSRVRDNTSLSNQEGSCTFLMHGYGSPAECLSQTITTLKNFTPYKVKFSSWWHDSNSCTYKVTVGTSAGDGTLYNGEISTPSNSDRKDQSFTFTTQILTEDSYVFAITRKTSNKLGNFDRMTLVAANGGGIGITGATGASFLSGYAIAPEGAFGAATSYSLASTYATSLVTNGTFDSNANGWTTTTGASNKGTANNQTGAFTGNFWENWNSATFTGKMYQSVSDVPNGTYKLNICAFVEAVDPDKGQYVYANSNKSYVYTSTPTAYTVYTYVDNHILEYGLEQATAVTKWMGIDNVSLEYCGASDVTTDGFKAIYDATTNHLDDGDYSNVTGSEKTALQTAVVASPTETADGYATATFDIGYADYIFMNSKDKYDRLAAAISTAETYSVDHSLYDVTSSTTAATALTNANSLYVGILNARKTAKMSGKALGFEDGEYAPYTNKDIYTNLATIDRLVKDVASATTDEISTAITSFENASWGSANVGEVNAVYDGTFENAENDGAPAGWTMTNNTLGGDKHSRAFVGDTRLSEFNATNSAFFMRFDGTNSSRGSMYYYGTTNGYTIPLKAGTYYRLTVDFAGWGSTGKPLRLNIEGPAGFPAINQDFNTSVQADTQENTPQKFDILFKATVAGNYDFYFQTPGSDDNTHMVVISNIELKKAIISIAEDATSIPSASGTASVSLARAFSTGWSAVCLPFNATKASVASDAEIYEFTSETGSESVTLNFTSADNFVANTPYLVYFPTVVASGKVFSDVSYSPEEVLTEGTAFDFKGVYTVTDIAAGNWVISGGELKKASDVIALKPTRTYFAPKGSSSARIAGFTIDGNEVTGLKAVMAQQGIAVDGIYNLKGQKVSGQLKKGIYVVEGKKVVK